jgi:hypothetical protein
MVYGSYFGDIRVVELDPKTGQRLDPKAKPLDLAINCEASIMIYHEGWYYLLATHGSCCRGADSGYNIRVGRSRKVNGPFLDHESIAMIRAQNFFGLCDGGRSRSLRFDRPGRRRAEISCHYEADSTEAVPVSSTFARSFGKTAGRSRAKTSKKAFTRSSRSAPAPRSNWPSKACPLAAAALGLSVAQVLAARVAPRTER